MAVIKTVGREESYDYQCPGPYSSDTEVEFTDEEWALVQDGLEAYGTVQDLLEKKLRQVEGE